MKLKLILLAVLLPTVCHATTKNLCPDISSIKAGNFQGWVALNNLDDEPASAEDIAVFKNTIGSFVSAEWSADYLYGFGRCDYTSDIEVSLASSTLPLFIQPSDKKHWSWDGIVAHCPKADHAPQLTDCKFN